MELILKFINKIEIVSNHKLECYGEFYKNITHTAHHILKF